MASRVALDLLYWAMHAVSHRNLTMATEMTSEGGVFLAVADFALCISP